MQTKNQVSTISPNSRAPAPLSIALDAVLSKAANLVDNGRIPAEALPSGARVALEARLREFDAALKPTSPDRVRSIVGSLSTMPARVEDDPAKQRFMVEQFVAICSDVPEWALSKAASAFLRHEVGSGFFPQAGELRKHALRYSQPVEANRQKIAAVLSARVDKPITESAEHRAEVVRRWREGLAATVESTSMRRARNPESEPIGGEG